MLSAQHHVRAQRQWGGVDANQTRGTSGGGMTPNKQGAEVVTGWMPTHTHTHTLDTSSGGVDAKQRRRTSGGGHGDNTSAPKYDEMHGWLGAAHWGWAPAPLPVVTQFHSRAHAHLECSAAGNRGPCGQGFRSSDRWGALPSFCILTGKRFIHIHPCSSTHGMHAAAPLPVLARLWHARLPAHQALCGVLLPVELLVCPSLQVRQRDWCARGSCLADASQPSRCRRGCTCCRLALLLAVLLLHPARTLDCTHERGVGAGTQGERQLLEGLWVVLLPEAIAMPAGGAAAAGGGRVGYTATCAACKAVAIPATHAAPPSSCMPHQGFEPAGAPAAAVTTHVAYPVSARPSPP